MKHIPYDYQQEAYDQTMSRIDSGVRSLIIQLATRAGKSIIAAMLIEEFAVRRKEPVYFIGHKKILVTQMSDELTENGIRHGIIAPWSPQLKYRVQVISKDTFFNRFKTMKDTGWKPPKLMIIDEAHMAMGETYKKVIEAYPQSILIGLTATPVRLDGKSLGALFQEIIVGPTIKQLQKKGRLCDIEHYIVDFDDSGLRSRCGDYVRSDVLAKVDKPAVLSNIVHHWEDIAKGKKTLTFCASIQHAKDMAEAFNDAGYPTIALSSKDSPQTIREQLQGYYSGRYINLVSVDLFTMGFTVKECDCIIQARPTQSLMIYMQSLGRGMVWMPGKTLTNLDCVNNFSRHGLPEEDRIWSLGEDNGKLREVDKYKKCPACYHPVLRSARVCQDCGHQWTEIVAAGSRTPEEKSGKLVRFGSHNEMVLAIARTSRDFNHAIEIAGSYDIAYRIWTHDLKFAVDALRKIV